MSFSILVNILCAESCLFYNVELLMYSARFKLWKWRVYRVQCIDLIKLVSSASQIIQFCHFDRFCCWLASSFNCTCCLARDFLWHWPSLFDTIATGLESHERQRSTLILFLLRLNKPMNLHLNNEFAVRSRCDCAYAFIYFLTSLCTIFHICI